MSAQASFRPDIQGLRALSVVLVLVYHVFPALVPGGYVGVDVFFVISGFLITNILLKQAESEGRIAFLTFYMRRLRRLAPAATVTLAVAGAASLVILPAIYWRETAFEILAATFYVENFFLFSRSIDYLAEDSAPTLFQHYWSLSIEEQFYIVWPALIALTILACRAAGLTFRLGMTVLAGLVFASSLTASILLTAQTDGAYFLTHLRAWELALGGLLAAILPWITLPAIARTLMGWGGAAMVVAAGFLFGAETVFPGHAALLPVVGAALMLAAGGQTSMAGLGWLLSNPVARFVGDRSYSIYLVHWPLVIFALALNGGEMSWWAGLLVMALSVVLADLSFRFVENPFRNGPAPAAASGLAGAPGPAASAGLPAYRPRRVSFSGPLVLPAWTFSMSLAVAGLVYVSAVLPEWADRRALRDQTLYPGAMALLDPAVGAALRPAAILPSLAVAREDLPENYRGRCNVDRRDIEPIGCVFGDPDGGATIVLAGDSHAAHWLPVLDMLGERNGWRIVVHTKPGCALLNRQRAVHVRRHPECVQWGARVLELLHQSPPDLVIVAMGAAKLPGRERRALVDTWNGLADHGIPVIALRQTPRFSFNVLECVGANMDNLAECGRPRRAALPRRPVHAWAVEAARRAYLLDMSDAICGPERCEAVAGNILVYRDSHHLTATYARTMAGVFEDRLMDIMRRDATAHGGPARLLASAQRPRTEDHPGAAVLLEPGRVVAAVGAEMTPSLSEARRDTRANAGGGGCGVRSSEWRPNLCVYGGEGARARIVVVGDSHASHWMPAFEVLSDRNAIQVDLHAKASCPLINILLENRRGSENCLRWVRAVMASLEEDRPDAVIVAMSRGGRLPEDQEAALVETWDFFANLGIPVIAIAPTPLFRDNALECLAANMRRWELCGRDRGDAILRENAVTRSVPRANRAYLLDLNDGICSADRCEVVVGNVIVYRDRHHLTASYVRTLAGELERQLRAIDAQDLARFERDNPLFGPALLQ